MIFIGFHTSALLTSLKYKTMGLLDIAVLLLFLESHLFLSPTTSLMTPQWPGHPNGNKLIQTHLHLNETDQKGGSVSHTLLMCFPSPFANEPYLTPTLIVFHLLPPAILSTLFFSPFIPFNTNLPFSVYTPNCGGRLL